MGREIKRVALDFNFPLGQSWADTQWEHHYAAHHGDGSECDCDTVGTEPPDGEGWQLWQTVSDGPISPVFATPEELIAFMTQPDPNSRGGSPWAKGWDRAVAERFVRSEGWAPSAVIVGGQFIDGPTWMTREGAK